MVQLTAEERVLLVTTYLRTGSLEAARDAFRDRFADREPLTKMTKLETVIKENKTDAEAASDALHTGRVETTNATDFIEDQERKKRCKFCIIHGLAQNGTNTEEINNDVDLVELFFQQINMAARLTKFYRWGKSELNRNRPLKLEMANNMD